jgi:hypothetical protein
MKIAELVSRGKGAKVEVRVPSHLQEALGTSTRGEVRRILPEGSVTWVEIRLLDAPRGVKKLQRFRPQDLSAA